jgi:hypothetical protein
MNKLLAYAFIGFLMLIINMATFGNVRCSNCNLLAGKAGVMVAQANAEEGRRLTEIKLREVIQDLKNGEPNYEQMEPVLRAAVRRQYSMARSLLQQLGELQSVSYQGKEQGIDVYNVTFSNGATVWMISLLPDGKIATLEFRGENR